jgi:hypothetical protein
MGSGEFTMDKWCLTPFIGPHLLPFIDLTPFIDPIYCADAIYLTPFTA